MKNYLQISVCWFLLLITNAVFCQATLVTDPPNGHYCQGANPAGVQILIENSNPGTMYFLKRQGQPGNLAQVQGNGDTVTFNGYYGAGQSPWVYYTVPETNTVTVTRDPQPEAFEVTISNDGYYCTYPGAQGVEIGIDGSTPGVEYSLYQGVLQVGQISGNGSPRSFGFYATAGTYHVIAEIPATGCTRNLGSVTVTPTEPPTADFSAAPQNQCASIPVEFTDESVVNYPGAELVEWQWDFDDPNSGVNNTSTDPNPSHIFEAWGNGFQTFNVNLKVTDSYGCEDEISKPVTVKQKPDATLHAYGPGISTKIVGDIITFAYCGPETSVLFTFENQSTTLISNSWYHIDWGDGTPPFDSQTFNAPIQHQYNGLGFKTLTYTITGDNGCDHIKEYYIFVGSTPSGGLVNPGNTAGNSPFAVYIPLQLPETHNNTPGTTYELNFGDGSPIEYYTQEQINQLDGWDHTYVNCSNSLYSCNGDDYYGFVTTLKISNPCFTLTTSVCPIIVSCPVQPNFGGGGGGGGGGGNWGAGQGEIMACNPVTFSNETIPGFYITGNGTTFTQQTFYEWDFGDPDSGAANSSNDPNPTHAFTNSCQSYIVTLTAYTGEDPFNNSGFVVITNEVFIQENPVADFEMDDSGNNCVPKEVQMINTSIIGCFGVPDYLWTVEPALGWQITTPGFLNDPTYENPLFQFNVSGTYSVTLTITNSCGSDEITKTVLVCEPPEVAFDDDEWYYCGPGPRDFSEVNVPTYLENCEPPITYLWEVTGPEPVGFVSSTASTSKYPVINFPVNGTYSITLTITNSCGNDVATQIVHVTNALDNNIISTETPEVCSGDTPIVIDGTLPTGGTGSFTYIWWKYTLLNPNWTQIIPNVTTQNLELANPLTETTWFRRWAYDSGDCSSVSNEIEITVYPAIVNNLIVANQIICQGNAPELLTGTTAFGGNEPMTYQWYESTDGIDWNEILGAVDLDYQPGTLTQTTYFKRAAISDPCQPDYSMHVNITVCDPITLNSISEDQTICQGTQPELLTGTEPSGACGAFTYQWQIATDTNPIFADIPQENDQNYQPPAINVKTYFRRVVLSQMCLDNISNVVTIEIYPIPNVNAGMDQVISSGMNTTLNGTVSGGTPPYTSYTWEPAGKIASGGNTLNATTENLDATTIFSLTAIDSNGCVGTDNITVFVEGDPLSVTIDPALIQICPGQSVENLCAEPAGGTGNYQFSWNSSPPGFFSNVQCISVTPPTSTSYNVVVFDGYSTATASVVVEVLPVPVVTSLLDITICSNTQLNYEPTSTIAGSTFQWITTPGGSCTGNSSGQGTIIEDLLINNGVNDCVITYEIIPFGPIPPNCGGLPVALNVTVKSVPYVTNTISQQTIISGQLTEPVTFTSNIPEAVFEWEFFETDCEGFLDYPLVSGTEATIPSQIITILEGGPSQCYLTYRVTPSLNIPGDSCPGVHFDYTFIINLEPQSYTMICPEPICAGESVNVSLSGSELGVEYLLLRNGAIPIPPAKPGTGGQLDWENISIAGSYSIRATNLSNGQSSMMNGVCQVVVNPNPITFQLSALENEHCAPVTPLLSGSELYVDYELWLDETSILQTKAGTGNSELFYFDPVNDPGIYTVRAHDPFTGCSHWMSGSIIVDPSPQEFSIFPEGTLCEGVQLCIDGCEPGVEYQLWKDDDPFGPYFVGTASSTFICFPPTDGPGVYRVYARFIDTFCDRFFSDDQIVHENPLIYNLSPPSGCPGTEIFLDGCQEGIEYELWFDPPAKKSKNQKGWVITKTCDPNYQTLNFGQCWDEGTYTVKAVNPLTNCVSWMDDQTTIQAAPAIFNLVPNGIGCASQTLSLDGSETGVKYLLYQNGQLIDSVTGLATGTITFSTYSDIGIYTAKAKFDEMNGALPCWSDMNGSYEIISYPTAFTLSPLPGIYCPPLNAELSSSQIGINYYLENTTNGIEYGPFPGTGSTLTFPPINDPGEYQCNARHPDYPSCDKQMIGGFTISLPPLVYNLSGPLPSQYCQGNPGVTLTLENSQDGVEYQLYKLNPQLAIGLPQTGQSGESLEWTNITSGTYKVTAYFSTDPNCPMDMNNNVEVEEIANPTVFAGMDETICFSESYTVNDAQITDVSDFEWIILSGYGQLDNASVISPTYTPEDGDQGTTVALKLVAQGIQACSNLTAEDIVEIHFDPLPLVNAGEDNTICFNGSYTLADVTMTNVSEFIWTVFQGWGTLDDNTAVNPTYTPGLGDENMDVILRLEANGVLACISEVAQDDIIIHINPVPEIISPSQKIICSGESVNYLPESNINGTIFSWTSLNNTGGCITGNTTSSEGIIEDILVNDCKSVQFIKYSITPTGPPMTNCTGEEFELLVYINPLANVTNTENEQSINSNETTQSVSFQSDIIGSVVSFTWTGVASVPELENWITNGSGELPSMNIWIDDNGPTPPEYGSITYTVVPWVNGCEGNPFTYTIHVYLLPSVYQLSIEGGGEFCDDGINCINIYLSDSQIDKIYKVFLDNVYLPDYDKQGTNNGLEWCVNQSGEYMVQAFNPNTGVEIWMNGSAEVFARDLPENYTLSIVSPDDNCVPVSFKLEGSQPEAKYDLYFEYDGITQIAQPDVQGTGMTIYFNEQENAGNYYVVARIEYTEITCEKQMSGIITVSPLPEEYDLVTNSNFCTGQDSICMINSDTNVVYQLYKGPVAYGAEIQGTGEELCFGTISETGTYSILAKNIITLCERIFEQQVDVYPLPVKFSMSPDSACSGAEILLNNCQENIDYYLYWQPDSQEVYRESILVSGPLSCTVSSTLSFGVWENSGIYKIKAVNEFDCENWMDNSTVILPNPSTFEIQPQGFIGCEPVTVYLDYFENDVIYYLWRQDIQGNNHLMATGYGTNGPIIFGVQSEPGIYSVKAKRSRGTFNCFADMNGSLTIGIPPEIYTLKPVNDSCPPVGFYLSESQENVVYQLWSQSAGMLQEKQGLGNPVYFDLIDDPDDYYVLAINEIGCEIQMEGTRTILEPPSGYDVILTDGNICIDENPQIGLNWSDVGVTYELNRIAASYNPVAIANGQDAPLTFTPTFELEAGDYKVKAIDDVNSCEMWMNNTVTLFNPPDIYDITANGYVSQSGHFCPPVDIGLSFSQPAIIYSLIKEGITLSFLVGDGNSLSFGSFFEPGVYTITALNLETTCNSEMNGSVTISDGPAPYELTTENPLFCYGDQNAVTLILIDSQEGVDYQLYKNDLTNPVLEVKPGTNSALIWDSVSQFGEGNYFVVGKFPDDPECETTMINTIELIELSLPTAEINGDTVICETYCTQIPVLLTGEILNWQLTYEVNGEILSKTFTITEPHFLDICPIGTVTTTVNLIEIKYADAPACIGVVTGVYNVSIQPLPEANAGNNATVCESEEIYYIDEAEAFNFSSLNWNIEGIGSLNYTNVLNPLYLIPDISDPAIVTFTLTVFGMGDCSNENVSSTFTLSINPLPDVFAGENFTVCESEEQVMMSVASATYFTDLNWSADIGFFDNPSDLHPNYLIPDVSELTIVEIVLAATGTGECSENTVTSSFTLSINPLPDVFAGENFTVCESEEQVMMSVASATYFTDLNWSADIGSFDNPSDLHPNYLIPDVSEPTFVEIVLAATGTGECAENTVTSSFTLSINPLPDVFAGENFTVCESEEQ
ncbi:MAG TPA: PKD domain-containing protein, partial [Bacteroidales bacterium]|nr:PKD domain-containing protein [Bacteroidales bacterium]